MKKSINSICAVSVLVALIGCQREPAAAPERLAQYRTAVLSLLHGTYSGGCFGNDPRQPGEVSIDGAGVVARPGWKADLMRGTEMLILSQTHPRESGEWSVEVSGKPAGGGANALPALPLEGPDGFRCAFRTQAGQQKRASLYATVAPFFVQAAATLACSEGALTQLWRIAPGDSAVQVGQRTLSLVDGVATEFIHFDPRAGTLGYSVFYADGSMFGMNIDRSGKFVDVLTGGGASSFGCKPLT